MSLFPPVWSPAHSLFLCLLWATMIMMSKLFYLKDLRCPGRDRIDMIWVPLEGHGPENLNGCTVVTNWMIYALRYLIWPPLSHPFMELKLFTKHDYVNKFDVYLSDKSAWILNSWRALISWDENFKGPVLWITFPDKFVGVCLDLERGIWLCGGSLVWRQLCGPSEMEG